MRSLCRTLDAGLLRDIALVCLADGVVGASFGAISVAAGLPAWLPVTMSLLVFAGGAQFTAVGVLLAGGGPLAAAAAGLVLNTRHLPFGFTVADVLRPGMLRTLLGSHVIIDESVAFAVAQPDPARRKVAFWTCGIGLFVVWNLGVAGGVLAGNAIGDPAVFGLDTVFPAVLLCLVRPGLRERGTSRAATAGCVIALATTPVLPAGIPVLLALLGLLAVGRSLHEPGSGTETAGEHGC